MSGPGRYKIKTICQKTGLNPALLRAWERRYGLLEPDRTSGGHRLYTETDLRVLRRVQEILEDGRAIGEVANLGRERLLREAAAPQPLPTLSEGSERLEQLADLVVEGAVDLNRHQVEKALDQALATTAPDEAIEHVIRPALYKIGEMWSKGECSVAGEHMASHAIQQRLKQLVAWLQRNLNGRAPNICACFPDEQHELGVLIVAYRLARSGKPAIYLGGSLPFEDLERAIAELDPEEVYLSVTRDALFLAHRHKLLELARRHNGSKTFHIGGQGCPADDSELEEAGIKVLAK